MQKLAVLGRKWMKVPDDSNVFFEAERRIIC